MIVNIDSTSSRDYEVCVVGAGPAGIIFSLEYSKLNPGHTILLIECGSKGTTINRLDDSIKNANPQNHHDPYDCTNKGLGGSTISWGGRCVMYDEIDFMPHGDVDEDCTWDLDFYKDTLKWLDCSSQYFKCGNKGLFDLNKIERLTPRSIAENFKSDVLTDTHLERWSLPTRFGKQYRKEIENSQSIHLLTGYYADLLNPREDKQGIDSLTIKPLNSDAIYSIRAKQFIVTAGGQESTRLLLKSQAIFSSLPKLPAALGKYYQGHTSGKIAYIKFYGDPNKTDYEFIRDKEGIYLRRRFQFTTEALIKNKLLNIAFWLDNPPYHDPSHGNGTLSFIYLMITAPMLRKKLLPPAIAHSMSGGKSITRFPHILNVLKGLPGSLTIPASIFFRRYLCKRSLPGVFLKSANNRYALHYHSEQIPLKTNQMKLSDDGEQLQIHYKYSDKDIDSVILAHRLLDKELRHRNCGELEFIYPEKDLPEAIHRTSIDGLHQVGTTRIANSPDAGVVDIHLRVFGNDNLYVCSSSVFPTSGQANPTFYLGACAARLAHHLNQALKR